MRASRLKNAGPGTSGVPWGWAVAGALAGGLLCLLAVLPARWVASAVSAATGQRIVLQDVRGSVWDGSAMLVLAGGAGSRDARALPGRLQWQLRPEWKTAPGMRVQLRHAACGPVPVRLSWQAIDHSFALSGLDCQLPAQLLAGLGTPWNTLGFEGAVKLSSDFLQWPARDDAGPVRGTLEVQALSLSSRLSTLRPLGNYRLRLSGQDAAPGLRLELATLQGALRLEGRGQRLVGRWRFQGQAQAEPGQYPVLANILNLIGNRGGDIAWNVLRSPAS